MNFVQSLKDAYKELSKLVNREFLPFVATLLIGVPIIENPNESDNLKAWALVSIIITGSVFTACWIWKKKNDPSI